MPTTTRTPVPRATSTATSTATPVFERYTVSRGDSVGGIAERFDIDLASLLSVNGMKNDSILTIGQEIVLPRDRSGPALTMTPTPSPTRGEIVHKVVKGDTLGGIAVKYDTASQRIADANDIAIDSILSLDQELIIPGITATPSPTLSTTPSLTATRPIIEAKATRLPTPDFTYHQPRLLAPALGDVIDGNVDNILLNWTSVGALRDDEFYMVQLLRSRDGEALRVMVGATSFRFRRGLYPDDEDTRDWVCTWSVTVVRYGGNDRLAVPQSQASAERTFRWLQPIGDDVEP